MQERAEIMLVTPEIAQRWLQQNTRNRRISNLLIERYADNISNGSFPLNGDTITFSASGALIDGQHRLLAIIRAGKAIRTVVVFGVSEDVGGTKDVGKRRTSADELSIYFRCKNVNHVAAAARLLFHYDANTMHQFSDARARPDNQTILIVCRENPGLEDSSVWGSRVQRLMSPSIGTFCHYIFQRVHDDFADSFFESLMDGAGLEKTSPILLLRNRLNDNNIKKAKLNRIEISALVIKAWNYWMDGTQIRFLRWRTAKSKIGAEPFPKAK